MEFREVDKKEYEMLCSGRSIPLTQQWFYGEWHEVMGRRVWRYAVEDSGRVIGFFQLIKFSLPFNKSYLYVPHGPVFVEAVANEAWMGFRKFCERFLERENAIFFRFDPTSKLAAVFYRVPKFLYDGSFQPKYEWVLDITRSEEEILAGMKKVNRYTVRQAERAGVKVEIINRGFGKYLDKFYELMEATSSRDGFSHSLKEYYIRIFDVCEKDRNGFMELAHYDGRIMLINFFVFYGDDVFFLFSASENENRRIGYTYLAQWEAMKYAKRIGLRRYNFGAVIPENNSFPFYRGWRGFSDFKQRFGGSLVEYGDFYDVVFSRAWYAVYILKKLLTFLARSCYIRRG